MSLFALRNVDFTSHKKKILENINLDLQQQEIFGLIGASGAGKTTLLRIICGYYKPTKGSIFFNDQKNVQQIRNMVGFASQDSYLYEELTIEQNLHYFGKLYGLQKEFLQQQIVRLLKLVELEGKQKAKVELLSGGMKKRANIACALLHNPPILIMDEPTSGLDPLLKKQMWQIIQRINNAGRTVILSTHMIDDVSHLSHKVGMMFNGKLQVVASPGQLIEMNTTYEEIRLRTFPGNYSKILKKLEQKNIRIKIYLDKEHQLLLYVRQATRTLEDILPIIDQCNEHLIEASIHKPGLNQIFEAYSYYFKQ